MMREKMNENYNTLTITRMNTLTESSLNTVVLKYFIILASESFQTHVRFIKLNNVGTGMRPYSNSF